MKWLNRDLVVGPYLVLVTSREEFARALKKLGITDSVAWMGNTSNASTTELISDKGKHCCIVSLDLEACADRSPIQIAGILVHEAVHVFQNHCDHIGEARPSREFAAYSIQAIASRLMTAYADKVVK